ncbi:MAG: thioredoxin [Candidatus Muproteobacteria bacterium RIFCSPHIGHO2_12_FULL_60_33]|uniref:Thioredoxin n=1 Tax=Candidatus Muproteobacteria bacterium RIFCSPLOWO2_01_FULL_60_18 TaxID=1817768 RepID=A0A1F6U3E8_9PROT|nr:MAG: thioredoxin [Candidatus Muproteobacteria bacterium RIFCSPHIGHO2_01_60_12]OGI51878.1 MAG: thioredoxin [Candidatus Muproteobacteria bacterium RIFCSPLOWO2_01_FULL_60_18]OGI54928.1 MAG: thioredoxin [Candidatus Muproteobacteria bacterium RIFCSPHIGHO2_12_FULL_60_33]OGI56686.1 MAG: thioredoxin [Candidatus Muproteobacteria bacterium RIFCSPHIGHO2_02_FULL_60_13]OGI57973.1 MAG: thioredoxin [Candidatus Muproteobacteria bacterium RIFCSPHIGHO2_01_FULL_61_200]
MATVEVTQENLHQIVSENNMVIVDFWAPWCGPCRSFAPAYETASEKYPDVVFAKVNTEEQQALAGYFQIRSIPTLMIFREKIIIFAQPGALPASALDQVIEKAKALDMNEVRREIEQMNQDNNSGTADERG